MKDALGAPSPSVSRTSPALANRAVRPSLDSSQRSGFGLFLNRACQSKIGLRYSRLPCASKIVALWSKSIRATRRPSAAIARQSPKALNEPSASVWPGGPDLPAGRRVDHPQGAAVGARRRRHHRAVAAGAVAGGVGDEPAVGRVAGGGDAERRPHLLVEAQGARRRVEGPAGAGGRGRTGRTRRRRGRRSNCSRRARGRSRRPTRRWCRRRRRTSAARRSGSAAGRVAAADRDVPRGREVPGRVPGDEVHGAAEHRGRRVRRRRRCRAGASAAPRPSASPRPSPASSARRRSRRRTRPGTRPVPGRRTPSAASPGRRAPAGSRRPRGRGRPPGRTARLRLLLAAIGDQADQSVHRSAPAGLVPRDHRHRVAVGPERAEADVQHRPAVARGNPGSAPSPSPPPGCRRAGRRRRARRQSASRKAAPRPPSRPSPAPSRRLAVLT